MMTLCEEKFLTGTHGTSMSRALSIIKQKRFMPSADGLFGSGVYFWEVSTSLDFSKKLAKNWWRFSSLPKNNVFKDDADKSQAILKATIKPKKNEFYDATSDDFLLLCADTAENQSLSSKDDLIKLRAALVVSIEEERKLNFSVVKIDVEVPGQARGEPAPPSFYWLKKQAACYVVKNKAEEIIQDIELIEA